MGLSKLPHLSHSLYASLKAPRTFTITLLPSLAVPGGAFDAPTAKCLPPERGRSSLQVTAAKASYPSPSSPIPFSQPLKKSTVTGHQTNHKSEYLPLTPPPERGVADQAQYIGGQRSAVNIPISRKEAAKSLATPPLTPEDHISKKANPQFKSDALDFLLTVFPHHGVKAAQHAKKVAISVGANVSFTGVVLAPPGEEKALYVLIDAKSTMGISLRESIVALMDLASEIYDCTSLVLALEKNAPSLPSLLHSLMYVGGQVVTRPKYPVASTLLLVGLEL